MVQTIPGRRMTDPQPPSPNPEALETMARQLEASGRYRLLRRFEGCTLSTPSDPSSLRHGVYLDVETTGKDAAREEIIELAMVPFQYDAEGRLCAVGTPFVELREPSKPISEEITRITGITNEMVAGKSIDPTRVAAFIEPAVIIAAHNAQFDRRFTERFCEAFQHKGWACSMSQVDWAGEGFEGTKLSYLASQCGFFFDGHRAENDCLAGLEILARPLSSGKTALAHMLDAARAPTWRIAAERAPFDFKDRLKARGYRWNGEEALAPKAWYIDVAETDREAELQYLRTEIYGGEVHLAPRRITAFERFSERA
jgi:DNA polymerase-3 subunit epsilon